MTAPTARSLIREWDQAILALPTPEARTAAYIDAILELQLLIATGEQSPQSAQSVLAAASTRAVNR